MNINTYNLILDTETKHSSLQVKESYEYANDYFASAKAVYLLLTELFHLHQMSDEYVYMLAFDNRMKILGVFEVSHGIGNASLLDARGVFIRALQIGASNIMLAHNHPSGIPLPSREDFSICKRIVSAGKLLGVPLLDFIVIGSDDYVSFLEKELL